MMNLTDSIVLREKISTLPAADKDALLAYLCGYVPDAVEFCLQTVERENKRRRTAACTQCGGTGSLMFDHGPVQCGECKP